MFDLVLDGAPVRHYSHPVPTNSHADVVSSPDFLLTFSRHRVIESEDIILKPCTTAACLIVFLSAISARSQQLSQPITNGLPSVEIERRSRNLKHADREEIKALTTAVAADAGITGPLADAAQPMLKEVAEAEYKFHAGSGKGVHEKQVIDTVNLIAQKMGAPAYAQTGIYEVRSLRARIALSEPHFIGRHSLAEASGAGGKHPPSALLNSKMSPLEAVHVAALLLIQKIENPTYQMTDEERKASRKQDGQHPPHLTPAESNRRLQEMHTLVYSASSKISMMDVFQLSITSLQTLTGSNNGSAQ